MENDMSTYWFPIGLAIFGIVMLSFIWWLHQMRKRLHQQGIVGYNEEITWSEFWKRIKRL